jgi:hypothetical protein
VSASSWIYVDRQDFLKTLAKACLQPLPRLRPNSDYESERARLWVEWEPCSGPPAIKRAPKRADADARLAYNPSHSSACMEKSGLPCNNCVSAC